MIIKVSFIVVASVAALKISQTKTSSSTKRNGTIKSPGNDGSHLEQEFEERENGTLHCNANHVIQNEEEKQIDIDMPQDMPKAKFKDFELLIDGEKMDDANKKEILQNLVQIYKQREVKLERKLLELNGMREEQLAIAQMQRQLEKKMAKLDFLKKTIASLQSESKIIQAKIREDFLSKQQLDIAKKMIKEMQMKKDVSGGTVKEQILMLQQQVTELQKYNCSGKNAMVNRKLKDVQHIELEVLELQRRNKELELEKREMGIRLATAQERIRTELLQEEREVQIKEEITGLQHVHEELSEQVERMQRSRFDMVQELVYQRWLYTLLRFEVHNHKKQSTMALRGYSQNSSKELYGKTHALTPDPELESISSNATMDESDETETTTFDSSSSSQRSSSNNSSMLGKMKRWSKTKDYSNKTSPKGRNFPSSLGLIRRSSMSMVASDVSKSTDSDNNPAINQSQTMNSSSKSIEKPKIKRVSFSDSVKLSTYQDMPEAIENAIRDKETSSGKMVELTSSVVSWDKHKAEKYDEPGNSSECAIGNSINVDSSGENQDDKNKIGHSDKLYSRNVLVCRNDHRIKTILVQLVAFVLFSLVLLVYFRIK